MLSLGARTLRAGSGPRGPSVVVLLPQRVGTCATTNSRRWRTALGITAAYMFWRWLRVPTWTGAFFSGVLLGAALLTKLTWIIVLALWPMLWLVCRQPWRRNTGSPARPAEIAQLALILAAALYTLNAGYGFEGSLTRLGQYQFVSQSLGGNVGPRHDAPRGNRFAGTWLGALPVPLPKNYVLGIDLQKRDFERGFWSYLRGQWRYGGWWYYYLYGLAVKVPLGTWALAIAAVLASLGRMPFRPPLARRNCASGACGGGARAGEFADRVQPPSALCAAHVPFRLRLDEQGCPSLGIGPAQAPKGGCRGRDLVR